MDVNYGPEGEDVLNENEKARIRQMMMALAVVAREVKEPIDPKIETCLELAFELLKEQLALDKAYKYGPIIQEDDKFLGLEEEESTLSVEELWKMFEGEGNEPPMPGPE